MKTTLILTHANMLAASVTAYLSPSPLGSAWFAAAGIALGVYWLAVGVRNSEEA